MLGLLLLLLPLVFLLPTTSRKLLFQDVHRALEDAPFPFRYLPRRDSPLCLALQDLKLPWQSFQLLLRLVARLKSFPLVVLVHPMVVDV